METSWGPLHLDCVDKSRRVGVGCFGEASRSAPSSAPPLAAEGAAVWRSSSPTQGASEDAAWRLALLGGVELSGRPGVLEVSLRPSLEALGDAVPVGEAGRVVLMRTWSAADALAEVVVCEAAI